MRTLSVVLKGHEITCDTGSDLLVYEFSECDCKGGFSAWSVSGESNLYEVALACKPMQATFSQHALNYPVASAIIRQGIERLQLVGFNGGAVDLPRLAKFLSIPCDLIILPDDVDALRGLSEQDKLYVEACLSCCANIRVSADSGCDVETLSELFPNLNINSESTACRDTKDAVRSAGFDYTIYEMVLRDHPLLVRMQQQDAEHFKGCKSALDLGAGVGIFLDVLRQSGIEGVGVERNEGLVSYGRAMGLNLQCRDALEYLQEVESGSHDGVYCSHFVEHLPIDAVERLIHGIARVLQVDGVAVLAFPDPESIRSQLLGFWRDPEHVRFYHPYLISNLCAAQGLQLEWSSYDTQPHEIYPFSLEPPEVPRLQDSSEQYSYTLWERLLKRMGLAVAKDLKKSEKAYAEQKAMNAHLLERTEQLWSVNKTWAWNDNVTLRFRKK